jgi:hypothetical protein
MQECEAFVFASASTGLPSRSLGTRPGGLIGLACLGPGGLVLAGQLMEPADQGETLPDGAGSRCVWWGKLYPASCCVTWREKILEGDGRWVSPGPGQRR